MKKTLIASLVALTTCAFPTFSDAAGLGRLHVYSALGQPLQAEIDLSASAEELQSLTAKIASPEAFMAANVSYSPLVPSLQVSVQRRGDRHVVRIVSPVPINDPFMDLVIELNWASGRLVREYIFLLDPADLKADTVAAPVTPPTRARAPAPSPQAAPTAPAQASPPPASTRTPPAQQASPPPAPATPRADTHAVVRGDTLNRIALRYKPEQVTLDQMLVALFRANPDAFEASNMNRLRSGRILTLPTEAAFDNLTPAHARTEVLAHARDFNRYRQRLAASVPPPRSPDAETGAGMSGRIAPKVEEDSQARGDAPRDQLQISRTQTGDTAQGSEGQDPLARMQALEEDIVAREKALDEAHARLSELEETVRELQALVELRNWTLAQMQQAAQNQPAPPPPEERPAPVAPPAADEPMPPETPQEAEAAPGPSEPQAAPVQEPAPPPAPPRALPPPPPPPPPESFLQSLMSSPMALGGAGAILLLLLGYLAYLQRKKKAEEATAEQTESTPVAGLAMPQEPVDTPQALVVKTSSGGGQVDTGSESSIMDTNFGHTSIAMIGDEEGVDPVAEADVYIAYGRDAEAERILVDALQTQSDRPAIHLKLMSIYADRGDLPQFEGVASQLYTLTGGEGEDWQKAAQMGRELDPTNPLYTAAEGTASPSPSSDTEDPLDLNATTFDLPEDTQMALPMEGSGNRNLEFDLPPDFEPSTESLDLSAISEEDENAKGLEFDFSAPFGTEAEQLDETPESESARFTDETASSAEALNLDEAAPPATLREEEASTDPDAGLDFDFDLPLTAESDAEETPSSRLEEGLPFDSSSLEFDLNIDEPPQGPASTLDLSEPVQSVLPAEDDFDFGDISLDMGEPTLSEDLDALSLGDPDKETDLPSLDDPVFDSSDSLAEADSDSERASETLDEEEAGSPEVDTKLELAEAYEEMGDKEGARELLNEVLQEGSAGQKAKAQAMIERLD